MFDWYDEYVYGDIDCWMFLIRFVLFLVVGLFVSVIGGVLIFDYVKVE